MSITIYPYKLDMQELEVRLESAEGLPKPGQLLRFEGAPPAYGQVTAIRQTPSRSGGKGYLAKIRLLHGRVEFTTQPVAIVNDDDIPSEVRRLQGEVERPIRLGPFALDPARLDPLTIVTGDDFVFVYQALMQLVNAIQAQRQLLIVDPLGLFSADDSVQIIRAGHDARLSVQDVGSEAFLNAFGSLLPEALRELAMRVLAEHWPVEEGFRPFHRFFNLESAVNIPMKNLILQQYHAAIKTHVFAETPDQVFPLHEAAQQPVAVLDVSELAEPWKRLFYEAACRQLIRGGAHAIIPVLIYPEHYLSDLQTFFQQAGEAGLSLIAVASPYFEGALHSVAANRVTAHESGVMHIQGKLTLGLPVTIPLADAHPGHAMPEAAAPLPSRPQAPVVDLSAPAPEATLPVASKAIVTVEQDVPPEIPEEPADSSVAEAFETADFPEPEAFTEEPPETFTETLAETVKKEEPLFVQSPPPFPEASESPQDEFRFDIDLDQRDESEWGFTEDEEAASGAAPSALSMDGNWERSWDFSDLEETEPDESGMPEASDTPEMPPLTLTEEDEPLRYTPAPAQPETEMVPIVPKPAPPQEIVNAMGFKAGDRVRHETYGVGVVNKVIPMEENVILNITFDDVGKRLLDPSLCNLSREAAD